MLFLDVNKDDMNNTDLMQRMLDDNKNVFVLVYMIGCQPCKQTLPEWNKLQASNNLKYLKDNNNIVVANIEQSMCKKLKNSHLDDIMSFPTIKHINHNEVHDYEEERSTGALSNWIKSIVDKDDILNDVDDLHVSNNDNINHGNLDLLFKKRPIIIPNTQKSRTKVRKMLTKRRKKKTKKKKRKRKTLTSNRKKFIKPLFKKTISKKKNRVSKDKSKKKKTNAKSRIMFQRPLSYTKSLPV